MTRRPRLLVLNQYYAPGVEATGQLLAQLCSDLAGEWDVTVVTGRLANAPAGRETRDGVEVSACARRRSSGAGCRCAR